MNADSLPRHKWQSSIRPWLAAKIPPQKAASCELRTPKLKARADDDSICVNGFHLSNVEMNTVCLPTVVYPLLTNHQLRSGQPGAHCSPLFARQSSTPSPATVHDEVLEHLQNSQYLLIVSDTG
jgi:hypothetical protein